MIREYIARYEQGPALLDGETVTMLRDFLVSLMPAGGSSNFVDPSIALRHDIGKPCCLDFVNNSSRNLTDEEFEIIKEHPLNFSKIYQGVMTPGDRLHPGLRRIAPPVV